VDETLTFTLAEIRAMRRYCLEYRDICRDYIDHDGRAPTDEESRRFMAFLNVLRGGGDAG
jgi:hypothetical protein